jgi:hypothetical protein
MALVEQTRRLRASQQPGKPKPPVTLRIGASPMRHRPLRIRHCRFRRRRRMMSRGRCRGSAVTLIAHW